MKKSQFKIKHNAIWVISILATILVVQSCTEGYDISLNNIDPVLVVDGSITDQSSPNYIRLAKSAEYFSNETSPAVLGAEVSVDDGFDVVQFQEMENLPGFYKSPEGFQGVVGRTYHLLIENVDINNDGIMEVYEAEDYLKPVAPIDSVTMDYLYEFGTSFWRIWLHAWDPPETSDFYVFKVYKNDSIVTDQIQDWSLVDDEFFAEGKYASADIFWLEEEDEDGNRKFEAPNLGDVYVLEMGGVTEKYLDYLLAVQLEMWPKVPIFSGPAANIPTNVSNGAVGFFSAYSISIDSIIVTQEILDLKK